VPQPTKHKSLLVPEFGNPHSTEKVDSKLAEELLRQEVAEATSSCLDAARAEASKARAASAAAVEELRSKVAAAAAEAAAAAQEAERSSAARVDELESTVGLSLLPWGCGGLLNVAWLCC
jgi:hypothetical protein